jgi:protein TonB
MDANKILSADVLDIIFEGKNKEYGAYNLRRTYNKRLTTALVITVAAIALILLINFLANAFHKEDTTAMVITDVSLSQVKKETPPPPPPKAVLPPPPPQVATVKFTPPVIKKDNEVPPDTKPPVVKDNQAISNVTNDVPPTKDAGVITPPVTPPGTNVAETPTDDNTVFTKVEIEAAAPANWASYLGKNLNATVPTDNGAPPGTYRVLIQFIVSKDGSVSDVHATTSYGYGMEEEAVRAIKLGPKWKPAQQNGRSVNAYRIQPIIFQVEE